MIEVEHLTKRYGDVVAVDDISFTVRPGRVTGFLGRNGAGKSTTMRMILGLDAPTSGRVLVGHRRYRQLDTPLRTIGALLDAGAVDDGRTAADHLLWLAHSNRIERARVGKITVFRNVQEDEFFLNRHTSIPCRVDPQHFGVFGANHVAVRQGETAAP